MEHSSLLERIFHDLCLKDYSKALEVMEDVQFQGNDMGEVYTLQGSVLKNLGEEAENTDVKFSYWLGAVECFSRTSMGSVYSAGLLFKIAELIGSKYYYKKSLRRAKKGLDQLRESCYEKLASLLNAEREELEFIVKTVESRIAVSKTLISSKARDSKESNDNEEVTNSDFDSDMLAFIDSDFFQEYRSSWASLNVELKKNLMKVSTVEFKKSIDDKEGKQALEQALTYAKKNRRWKSWICRTCLKRFSTPEEFTMHVEQEHAADFYPKDMLPQRISDVWARKISVGGWEPVNAEAAVEMIKNHPTYVKAFAYENGWSKDWPPAVDEERSKLLKDIQLLLVSFCDRKILSCSIQDRLMHFLVKQLEKSDLSKDTITDCRLVETPQGICFLECPELSQILAYLRKIRCERDDGKDIVCRAVNSFCGGTRYKEKIDFDPGYSTLLLDKRLLYCKVPRFDDEATVSIYDPNVHYAKARAQGEDFMSWLTDYSSGHKNFRFPRPIRAHNIGMWVAVLRAVEFTCKTMRTKYAKKLQLLGYKTTLTEAGKLCIEDDKRNLLCERCEEVDNKVALIDSYILLIENSRISLLNDLTRLSVFDYRFYIHHPLRAYLLASLRNR